MTQLFEPFDLGPLKLANRVVMAPMTRARTPDEVPDDLTALYYAQRAGAGLIISEGIPVSREGRGYLYTPGLYDDEQVAGWRSVTKRVHEEGGRIFAQLWHVGRVSHRSLQPEGAAPVGPGEERAEGAFAFATDADGTGRRLPVDTPRALREDEIPRVVEDFVTAARHAVEAGFDGIEIHGANGYLFEQFINGASNQRTDRYGGTVENRLRLLLQTLDAIVDAIGRERTGVRISPYGRLNAMRPFADEAETWLAVARELDRRAPVYVHLSDQLTIGAENLPSGFADAFCRTYRGTLIAAGGFDKEKAQAALDDGHLDLVAVGRGFIANPDLVERWRHDRPLAAPVQYGFYGAFGPEGYTDYPSWNEKA